LLPASGGSPRSRLEEEHARPGPAPSTFILAQVWTSRFGRGKWRFRQAQGEYSAKANLALNGMMKLRVANILERSTVLTHRADRKPAFHVIGVDRR
jgi:hypothetical protein